MDGYVKSVLHLLPQKVTEHLWKDQAILVITLLNASLIIQKQKNKEATKTKMTYLKMCNRGTDVWKLAQEASLTSNTTKIDCNRFVIKSFFCIIDSMIIKNWAYTHNFHDVVHLVAHCGGKEISTHLIMAATNATYISPEYITKHINIMTEFAKKPLNSTMKGNEFRFYSDETRYHVS